MQAPSGASPQPRPHGDFVIPFELARAVHAYLMERPCGEVRHLVDALERLEPAPGAPEPEADTGD